MGLVGVKQSSGRIVAIALNLVKETIREQVFYLSLVYTGILVAAMVGLPQFSYDSSAKMIVDVGMAAIELIALVAAVFIAANLLNKEIEKRTIFVLVAKPLSRAEFIIGKHLGISAIIAILVLIMTVIFLTLIQFQGIQVPQGAILIASGFIFWQIMLVSALAILFGAFTSSIIASLLTLVSYLIGNFSKDLLELGQISQNETVQNVTRLLYLVLPDLSRANLKNEAVYGVLPPPEQLFTDGVYIFSYALLVLAIAILVFGKRSL